MNTDLQVEQVGLINKIVIRSFLSSIIRILNFSEMRIQVHIIESTVAYVRIPC